MTSSLSMIQSPENDSDTPKSDNSIRDRSFSSFRLPTPSVHLLLPDGIRDPLRSTCPSSHVINSDDLDKMFRREPVSLRTSLPLDGVGIVP